MAEGYHIKIQTCQVGWIPFFLFSNYVFSIWIAFFDGVLIFETFYQAYSAAKSLQSYPTLCDPIDGSPPGSPSLGFSRQEHWSGLPFPSPMHESEKWVKSLSHVRHLATPWTAAHQAPPSTGFSRQEYWSGVPLPSPKHILELCYSNVATCKK